LANFYKTIAGLADDARAQTFFINFGGVFVVDRLSIRTSMAMGVSGDGV
jgi:hypothetical protein